MHHAPRLRRDQVAERIRCVIAADALLIRIHLQHIYLKGEGPYKDREQHPAADLAIVDSRLPDGTGVQLFNWTQSQDDLCEVKFCLFSEFPDHVRKHFGPPLSSHPCVLEKPATAAAWPLAIKSMVDWSSPPK